MSRIAINIYEQTSLQINQSILLILGLIFFVAINNAIKLTFYFDNYFVTVFNNWFNSGTTLSSAIVTAVSIGIALVGSVSLLSPQFTGGFIISGLIILFFCVLLGLFINTNTINLVRGVSKRKNKLIVDSYLAAIFEGFIAIQFLFFLIGIGLILCQVIINQIGV
jgi:hypothetical protein